eukprot:1684403-Amphidinium_carterae.1
MKSGQKRGLGLEATVKVFSHCFHANLPFLEISRILLSCDIVGISDADANSLCSIPVLLRALADRIATTNAETIAPDSCGRAGVLQNMSVGCSSRRRSSGSPPEVLVSESKVAKATNTNHELLNARHLQFELCSPIAALTDTIATEMTTIAIPNN